MSDTLSTQVDRIITASKDDPVTFQQLESVLMLSGELVSLLHKHSTAAMLQEYDGAGNPVIMGMQPTAQTLMTAIANLNFSLRRHGITFGPSQPGEIALKQWAADLVVEYLRKRQ